MNARRLLNLGGVVLKTMIVGTDQRLGVSFDQQDGSALGGWTGYGVIGAMPAPLGTL